MPAVLNLSVGEEGEVVLSLLLAATRYTSFVYYSAFQEDKVPEYVQVAVFLIIWPFQSCAFVSAVVLFTGAQ